MEHTYMHIRKDVAFTADEIRYLAGFPLITLEKTTGAKEFGSTEEGTLAAARAIKAIHPATKVLYYRNVKVLEPDYLRGEIGEKKKAGVVEGYEAMMRDARQILGPGKMMDGGREFRRNRCAAVVTCWRVSAWTKFMVMAWFQTRQPCGWLRNRPS